MKELIYIGCVIASVLFSIIISIVSFCKEKKNNKNSNVGTVETIKSDIKTFGDVVLKNIPKYMISAEQLYNNIVNPAIKKTGAQKLAYVLDKVKIDCLTNGVEYNEDVVTAKVEELIDLSNNVNSK